MFDLTTKAGIAEAVKSFNSKDLAHLIFPWWRPIEVLIEVATETIKDLSSATEATIKEQRDAAIAIIKAGKEHGAETMEVTMDQKAGFDLGSNVDGIPISVSLGKSGKMTIKVQYGPSKGAKS